MKDSTANSYQHRIQNVLNWIVNNIDGDLSILTLAHVANFSPYHFHRVFRAITNEKVGEFVIRVKLSLAARALHETNQDLSEIASRCGYESQEAFSRAFKRLYSVSPAKYRTARKYRAASPTLQRHPLTSRIRFDPDQCCATLTYQKEIKQMEIKYVEKPALQYACILHKGDYRQISHTFGRLMEWIETQKTDLSTSEIFSQSYDSPMSTSVEELRSEACISLTDPTTVSDDFNDIEQRERTAGWYATSILQGSYDGIAEAYQNMLADVLAQPGNDIADAPFIEIYLNDCRTLPEAEWLTELCIPLKHQE